MWCVLGLFRCLLGLEEDETRSTYHSESQSRVRQPLLQSGHNAPTRYESSWTTPSSTSSPCIKSQSKTPTTTRTPQKLSETIQKPFPSTFKLNLNDRYDYCLQNQPLVSGSRNAPTPHETSWKTPSATSLTCLGRQSNTQTSSSKLNKLSEASQKSSYGLSSNTTFPCLRSQSKMLTNSVKPEKSSDALKPTVLSPSTLKLDSLSRTITPATSSSSLGSLSKTQATSTAKRSSETIHKPKVLSPSSLQQDSFSSKPSLLSSKPTLSEAPFNLTMDQKTTNYVWVKKGTTALTYKASEDVEALIKNNKLPRSLKMRLSPSTYKDFFHTMLYAEDLYFEEWNEFEMKDVTLELENAAIYRRKGKDKNMNKTHLEEEDVKNFVAFEMDSVPHRRPFLLSRDFASVRPSGSNSEPFQGIIYRVVKSNRVLVEFGEDFHSQHYRGCKYSVKFSFNRICLKRAHHAIDSVSDSLFKNFLFPTSDCSSKVNMLLSQPSYMYRNLDQKQILAVRQIYMHHDPPPYLVEGPLCITQTKELSRTGMMVREAILDTYQTKPNACILICAPSNFTCDELVKSLLKEIPESCIFRANAAFREREEVLRDIIPSCRISGDCFSCPSLKELQKFKVVSSTYMSCFRLHNEGLEAGHFSHMFMLDASSTTEPEALVALAHFAHESTNVVVTGALGNSSRWVRSPIARRYGLMKSYFERLYEGELHNGVCHL